MMLVKPKPQRPTLCRIVVEGGNHALLPIIYLANEKLPPAVRLSI